MSGFTDTKYTDTIDGLLSTVRENVLKNPYYKFNDKKPTKVIYYKQNITKSTVDEGSQDIYQHIGKQSSIKFNKIIDFYLYGIDTMPVTEEVGEFGYEASEISGTCIILPKTIIPTSGDFFLIPYIKEDILFKVVQIQSDTFDNGANAYQIEYKLERIEAKEDIEKQVEAEYRFVVNNLGTDLSTTIESTAYELIDKLDRITSQLTQMYKIFFDGRVQNFVYEHEGYHIYDSYLVEFMIRNKIMSNNSDYIYVNHSIPVSKTFGYNYTTTLYYLLENPELLADMRDISNYASVIGIEDINSLFATRLHMYYKMEYFDKSPYNTKINILPPEVILNIKSGEYFDSGDMGIYNILIAYIHNDDKYIGSNIVDMVKSIPLSENKEFFYLIPIYIFIINRYIVSLMK